MTKLWDIDLEILILEKNISSLPGTTISRVLIDDNFAKLKSIKLTAKQQKCKGGLIWALSLGHMQEPKFMFYGQTIKNVIKQAKKQIKTIKNDNNNQINL